MLIPPVTSIDYRGFSYLRSKLSMAVYSVSDGQHIRVSIGHFDDIMVCLAHTSFGHGRICKAYYLSAQPHHCSFNAEPCPCAGLKEERRHHFVREQGNLTLTMLSHFISNI